MTESVLLRKTDSDYPQSLLSLDRPPDLWALGCLRLLNKPSVGICGSRAASEAGVKYAKEFGRQAAKHGFVVVSGYARGVDTAAHTGAMEAGGATIAVLAEGVSHYRLRKDLKPYFSESNLLAVSPYGPDDRWTSWRAMARNRIIVGLTQGLFVIEAAAKGGTIDAGLECIRQHKPLWVLEYKTTSQRPSGSQLLLEGAGVPVRTHRELGAILSRAKGQRVVSTKQLELV